MDIGRRQFGAFGLRLGGKLGANHLFDFRPVAIERGGQLVARRQRQLFRPQDGPSAFFRTSAGWSFKLLKTPAIRCPPKRGLSRSGRKISSM